MCCRYFNHNIFNIFEPTTDVSCRHSNPAYPFSYIQPNQTSTFQNGSANNYTSSSQQVRAEILLLFMANTCMYNNLTVRGQSCYAHARVWHSYRKRVDFCRHGILILCFRMVLPRTTLARTGVCGIDQASKQLDARVAIGQPNHVVEFARRGLCFVAFASRYDIQITLTRLFMQ